MKEKALSEKAMYALKGSGVTKKPDKSEPLFFKNDIKHHLKRLKAQFCKHLPRKSDEFCDKCYYCKHINEEVGPKLT